MLVIQTRWNDDDLSGRLLRQEKELAEDEEVAEDEYDKWEVVSYPAIAESNEYHDVDGTIVYEDKPGAVLIRKEGEALHPERFPVSALKRIRNGMDKHSWASLYQQNPVPADGEFFTKDMFRMHKGPFNLKDCYIFNAWDLAIGKKQTNDWTVGMAGALTPNDEIYVLDMVRLRIDTFDIVEAILDMAQRTDPLSVGIERGQLQMAIMPVLKRRMQERKIYPSLDETLTPVTDKIIRARPLQGRLQNGMIRFPEGQPWVDKLMEEFLRFPNGVHDDIVDSMSWLVRMSLKYQPPSKAGNSKKAKSWKDKLKPYLRGSDERNYMGA